MNYKKTSVLFIFVFFVLFFNFVFAEDTNTQNDPITITVNNEYEYSEEEIFENELQKYVSTPMGLKISATNLDNTINLKIKELEIIINELYNEIDEEHIVYLKERLADLVYLKEYLQAEVLSLTVDVPEEDILDTIILVRQRLNQTVRDTKDYLKDIVSTDIKQNIQEKLVQEKQRIRTEIIMQNKERKRELVKEHNDYVKENIIQPSIDAVKANIRTRVQEEKNAVNEKITKIDRAEIQENISRSIEKAVQSVDVVIQNKILEKKQILNTQRIVERKQNVNQRMVSARDEIMNALTKDGNVLVDANVRAINVLRNMKINNSVEVVE
jgi:hypothetical protein